MPQRGSRASWPDAPRSRAGPRSPSGRPPASGPPVEAECAPGEPSGCAQHRTEAWAGGCGPGWARSPLQTLGAPTISHPKSSANPRSRGMTEGLTLSSVPFPSCK